MSDQPTHFAILDPSAHTDLDGAALLAVLPFPETLEEARTFRDAVWPGGVLVDAATLEPVPGEEVRHGG